MWAARHSKHNSMRAAAFLAMVIVLIGVAWGAEAGTIEFGGNNRIKVQSEGHLDPYMSGVTGSSASRSDALWGMAIGLDRFNVFDAIGVDRVSVGDSFSGFDYTFGGDYNFWVTDGSVNWSKPARNQEPSEQDFQFGGKFHLTSVSFDSDYHITLGGYLSDLAINDLTQSALLKDLAQYSRLDFTLNVTSSSKTSRSFVSTLNSSSKSTWAGLSGEISGSGPVGTPEPGTLLLLASSLGAGAWFGRGRLRFRRS